jgi:hypothetical protein
MTKRLRIIFFVALAYFLIIIPVQSQQQNDLVIASGNESTQETNESIDSEDTISYSDLKNPMVTSLAELESESSGNLTDNS